MSATTLRFLKKIHIFVHAAHKMIDKVHEKGYRNNPLTDEQKKKH